MASSPALEVVLQGVPVHPVLNPAAQGDEFGLLMTLPYRQEGEGGGYGAGLGYFKPRSMARGGC